MSNTTCFIVRRGCTQTFDMLRREFGDSPERSVIWDRRVAQRRSRPLTPDEERRQHDRRQSPPETTRTWQASDFICVKIDAPPEPPTPPDSD